MDNDYTITATVSPEWRLINATIKLNNICVVSPLEQEFLCVYKAPYEQFEYLYFSSFDFKDTIFAVQTNMNGQNYVKILDKKPEKIFALRLFKKAKQNES